MNFSSNSLPRLDRTTYGIWAPPSPPEPPAPVPVLERALPWLIIAIFLAVLIAGGLVLATHGGHPVAGAHFHS